MYKITHVTILLTLFLGGGVISCSGHKILSPETARDSHLSCASIQRQYAEAQGILKEVRLDEHSLSGGELVTGWFFWPVNWITSSVEIGDAREGAWERIETLHVLAEKRNCPFQPCMPNLNPHQIPSRTVPFCPFQ